MAQRTCPTCGKEFQQSGPGHPKRYCSLECRRRYRYEHKEKPAPLGVRSCAQCGTKFVPEHWRQKYCSESCQDRAYYQRTLQRRGSCPVKDMGSDEPCGRPILQRGMCAMHINRFYRHGDPTIRRSKPLVSEHQCSVISKSGEQCSKQAQIGTMCGAHYQRQKRYGDPLGGRNPKGAGTVARNGYRLIGRKLEHRAVMEQLLGRSLEPHETVHHINGSRLDNRPENLELYLKNHTPGQSVRDHVRWAREIIAKYGHLVDD
jgi:HNH endonuclease